MKDLVSIIVPIMNVESYINVCLNSLVNQTYKNIEIILVNDISNDYTLKICKYYAKKDKRIRIITKKNKAIENKKNIGIHEAKGKYITFVEAGDKVEPSYINDLYHVMVEKKVDIVCQDYYGINEKPTKRQQKIYVFEEEEIIDEYLKMTYRSNSFGKLFKKQLFKNIEYPDYEVYDDIVTSYKLFHEATKLAYSPVKKYCLIEEKNNDYNDHDCIKKMKGCIEMLHFMEKNYPHLVDKCKVKICFEALDLFKKVNNSRYKKQMYDYVKIYRKYALKDSKLSVDKRIQIFESLLGYNALNIKTKLLCRGNK
jgi:glycosyltransferase involved in cell wall biosynthesis